MWNFNFQGNLLTLTFVVQLPISKKPIEGCTAASKLSPHAPWNASAQRNVKIEIVPTAVNSFKIIKF